MTSIVEAIALSSLGWPLCATAAAWAIAIWALKQDGDHSKVIRRLTSRERTQEPRSPSL